MHFSPNSVNKWLSRQVNLWRALMVVVAALFRTYPRGRAVREAWTGWTHLLWSATAPMRFGRRKTQRLRFVRLRRCRRCPLYDVALRTCGHPGEVWKDREEISRLGCWCYLPLAAGEPTKECWAQVNGADLPGWSDLPNPIP